MEQEGKRKDIERAFGVLQRCFNIVCRLAQSWSQKVLRKIMQACVILHNMIVEDEREMAEDQRISVLTSVLPPEVQAGSTDHPCFSGVRRRNAAIRSKPIHSQLKNDLIEHIWQRFQNRQNN